MDGNNKTCKLSVYCTPDITVRSPGSVQSCKIGYLFKNNAGSGFVIAEGSDLYLVQVEPQTPDTESPPPKLGQPHRLRPGFQKATKTEKIFSFPSNVHIESVSIIEQGSNWKILAANGIGEVVYCNSSGQTVQFDKISHFPVSWAQSIKLSDQNQVCELLNVKTIIN